MKERAGILVLFDIDGTLLKGAGLHHRIALAEGIREVTGHQTTLDGIATAGMLDRDLIALMLQKTTSDVAPAQEQIARACADHYLRHCREDLSAFVCPGVRETLQGLAGRGAVLGLVTGNLTAIGWRKVELAGLRQFFAVGAFSEDGATRADLARLAAQHARENALLDENGVVSLVGDHANDVRAAKTNGFRSVAVASGVMSLAELQDESPDLAVASLLELNLDLLA